MGKLITTIGFKTFDKDKRLLICRQQPMRSWTRHFFDQLYILLYRSNALAAINDVGGNPRNHADDNQDLSGPYLLVASAPGGQRNFLPGMGGNEQYCYFNGTNYNYPQGEHLGIMVGTDNTAVAPDDDALGTLINHGEAAGEFLYGGTELFGLTFANPNGEFTIRRYFTNISGGGITVEEVGIYCLGMDTDTMAYQFCVARDVTGGVAVADTEILEVTYTVQITV